jgi:hypothetical protein
MLSVWTLWRVDMNLKKDELFIISVHFPHVFIPKSQKWGEGKGEKKRKIKKKEEWENKDGSPPARLEAKRAGAEPLELYIFWAWPV